MWSRNLCISTRSGGVCGIEEACVAASIRTFGWIGGNWNCCKCGEIESCEHYVIECPEVKDLIREELKLLQQTGLNLWSTDIFLTVTDKNEYFQERLIINDIFEEFLERSGRLTKQHKTWNESAPPNTRERVQSFSQFRIWLVSNKGSISSTDIRLRNRNCLGQSKSGLGCM